MTKVTFIHTYIRNGQTYEAGSTYAFEKAVAEALIAHGAATLFEEAKVAQDKTTTKRNKK